MSNRQRLYCGRVINASEWSEGMVLVVTNPEEDCSPDAFRVVIDEVLAAPEPRLESIRAVEALRAIRADASE